MKKIVIINQSQALYYKALYEELAQFFEVLYITANKHTETYRGHSFQRDLVIPTATNIKTEEILVHEIPKLGLWARGSYTKLVEEFKPDYLIVHETSLFNLQAFFYARRHKKNMIISTEIGRSNQSLLSPVSKLVRKLIRKRTGAVIAHSPAAMESDLVEDSKVVRSFHAVETIIDTEVTASVGETVRIVYLGQVIERKGLDLFVEALASIKDSLDFQFTIIGGGELEWMNRLIKNYGLEDSVTCTGFLEGQEQIDVIDKHDIFVLPSRYDTYGAVTQEVASRGLALLISKNAGSHVMVNEGENGFVFDPENLSETVETIYKLSEKEERVSCMKNSLETAKDYSASSSARRIATFLT